MEPHAIGSSIAQATSKEKAGASSPTLCAFNYASCDTNTHQPGMHHVAILILKQQSSALYVDLTKASRELYPNY
jgi:hypothetical protein